MSRPLRVALVSTHPVQYQVPWIRQLGQLPEIDLHVFYAMLPSAEQQGVGFGVSFEWDLPLLDGYAFTELENVARHPEVARFAGCDTPGIRRALRRGAWDVVIVNGWGFKVVLQALLAARLAGIPCVVRGEANGLRKRPWWLRLLHRVLFTQYAAFLTIGSANRRYYRMLGVPEQRLFPAPYGVENQRFAAPAETVAERRRVFRESRGIAQDAVCFLFCGKLEDKKRPQDPIRALRRVKELAPERDIRLLVVGDGALLGQCKELARDLPVHFCGFLNQGEIVAAYAACDCLVLPSDAGETWGLVVNEAMAAGRPALVSDHVGCHEDLIITDQTGAVFPLGDIARMAELMASFADEPARLREMGRAARQHVAHFDVPAVVEGCVQAIRHVVKTGR